MKSENNVRSIADHIRRGPQDTLKSKGGGGTFDGMEQRVRQLETDLSYIKGKVEDMPTKDWMTTRLIWVVGAFLAISALVQVAIALTAKALVGT